ncbi:hypothetical protein HOD83_00975 [Candidatus Woesearchaeota archaeon]|jgi:hypothetical protein|nr:hypothetical protein [Candidatus Woesearchaeota archaeon]MBT4114695.1 hypothetical protein [Candidatus Woesearchaeota archaeon]MBT4248146.1 hypothetical protein [Candidatus Woesearchaeota archaeon]
MKISGDDFEAMIAHAESRKGDMSLFEGRVLSDLYTWAAVQGDIPATNESQVRVAEGIKSQHGEEGLRAIVRIIEINVEPVVLGLGLTGDTHEDHAWTLGLRDKIQKDYLTAPDDIHKDR